MDPRIADFVKPLYLDLDGVSHFDKTERVARLARQVYEGNDTRRLELLLLFQGLRPWLEKVGNFSRTLLALQGIVREHELRAVVDSLGRLDAPVAPEEIALAAARRVDGAGVNALIQRFILARKSGQTISDVAQETLRDEPEPDWLPARARDMLAQRRERVREICRAILEER